MQKTKNQKTSNRKLVPSNKPKSAPSTAQNLPVARASKQITDLGPGIIVQHREFVASLTGNSASFVLLGLSSTSPGYDINPGASTMFPWLSKLAVAYEKYQFMSLEFELVPRNSTSSSGAVYMAVDYDWDDFPASDAQELMSNHGAVSSDVWSPNRLRVDCSRMNQGIPWRYVLEGTRVVDNAVRMVYGGYLMVGIAGTATSVSFDLFVHYKCHLSLPALLTVDISTAYSWASAQTIPAGGTGSPPLGVPFLSTLRAVLSGIGSTPTLGSLPSGSPGYELSAGNTGTLSMALNPATAGSPPNAYSTDTSFDGALFNSVGTLIGYISTLALLYQPWSGPNNPAEWATNGARALCSYVIDLLALRRSLPSAAFFVPLITSVAGRTLSTSTRLSGRYVG